MAGPTYDPQREAARQAGLNLARERVDISRQNLGLAREGRDINRAQAIAELTRRAMEDDDRIKRTKEVPLALQELGSLKAEDPAADSAILGLMSKYSKAASDPVFSKAVDNFTRRRQAFIDRAADVAAKTGVDPAQFQAYDEKTGAFTGINWDQVNSEIRKRMTGEAKALVGDVGSARASVTGDGSLSVAFEQKKSPIDEGLEGVRSGSLSPEQFKQILANPDPEAQRLAVAGAMGNQANELKKFQALRSQASALRSRLAMAERNDPDAEETKALRQQYDTVVNSMLGDAEAPAATPAAKPTAAAPDLSKFKKGQRFRQGDTIFVVPADGQAPVPVSE